MNRALRKGPLGLSWAWLAAAESCDSKQAHDQLKEDLSNMDQRDARLAGRDAFGMCARQNMFGFPAVVQHEKDLRGGDTSEPMQLDCAPGPLTRLARQALAQG